MQIAHDDIIKMETTLGRMLNSRTSISVGKIDLDYKYDKEKQRKILYFKVSWIMFEKIISIPFYIIILFGS